MEGMYLNLVIPAKPAPSARAEPGSRSAHSEHNARDPGYFADAKFRDDVIERAVASIGIADSQIRASRSPIKRAARS